MLKTTIEAAKLEAIRFLEKVAILEVENNPPNKYYNQPCQFMAAVKRSSMDLTRSLAKVRKTTWNE